MLLPILTSPRSQTTTGSRYIAQALSKARSGPVGLFHNGCQSSKHRPCLGCTCAPDYLRPFPPLKVTVCCTTDRRIRFLQAKATLAYAYTVQSAACSIKARGARVAIRKASLCPVKPTFAAVHRKLQGPAAEAKLIPPHPRATILVFGVLSSTSGLLSRSAPSTLSLDPLSFVSRLSFRIARTQHRVLILSVTRILQVSSRSTTTSLHLPFTSIIR